MQSTRKRRAPFPAKRARTTPRQQYIPRRYTPSIRPESKFVDVNLPLAANTTGAFQLLNPSQPGTGAGQRIGMKVSLTSVELRHQNYCTVTTGMTQLHRVIIVLDTQPNGVALALLQVLVAVDVYSPKTLANRNRFRLLSDKVVQVGSYLQSNCRVYSHTYIKFRKPIIVEFNNGVAGTIGDIVNNAIFVILIGSEPAGATAGTMYGYSRIRYTDV